MSLNLATGTAPWKVVAENPSSGLPVPRPATVYPAIPGIGPAIGGLPSRDVAIKPGTWGFELCFCPCTGAESVALSLTAAFVDDVAHFSLLNSGGTQNLGKLPLFTAPPTAVQLAAISAAAMPAFRPGRNCLRVQLENVWPEWAQLALTGAITGADAACPAQP